MNFDYADHIARLRALAKKISVSDVITVMGVWLQLAFVDMRLRFLPVRLNKQWLHHRNAVNNSPLSSALTTKVLRLEGLVMRASAHPMFFNMSCLRRALVMRSILATWGIGSRLVFGVHMHDGGNPLEAHAWLDLGAFCLGLNASSVRMRFVTFSH